MVFWRQEGGAALAIDALLESHYYLSVSKQKWPYNDHSPFHKESQQSQAQRTEIHLLFCPVLFAL